MSDSEELGRLADLHQRGALSDEEFARAKARVLDGRQGSGAPEGAAKGLALNRLRRSRDDRWLGGVWAAWPVSPVWKPGPCACSLRWPCCSPAPAP